MTTIDADVAAGPSTDLRGRALTTQTNQTNAITFRLPRNGFLDPVFSGTRSFWNLRVLPCKYNAFTPPVKSVVVKQDGTKRGVRFIFVDSAREYLERLAKEQANVPGNVPSGEAVCQN
jgi:hypothetical protein